MEIYDPIVTGLDTTMRWYAEQPPEVAIGIPVSIVVGAAAWAFFLPLIQYKWQEFKAWRAYSKYESSIKTLYWKALLREGKRMSQKKDFVADAVSDALRIAQRNRRITLRDRKNYLKLLEDLFGLQGKLLPIHRSPYEVKAAIRKRMEQKTVRRNEVIPANEPIPFPDRQAKPAPVLVVVRNCRVISAS